MASDRLFYANFIPNGRRFTGLILLLKKVVIILTDNPELVLVVFLLMSQPRSKFINCYNVLACDYYME